MAYNGYGDAPSYHCHQGYNTAFPASMSPTHAGTGSYAGHLQYGASAAAAAAVAAAAAGSAPTGAYVAPRANTHQDKSDP